MTAGKTVPELTPATPPIVGTDELVVYRSPGPLKRATATVFSDYIKAFYSASTGATLVTYLQTGTGAFAQTVADWFEDQPTIMSYIPFATRVAIRLRTSVTDLAPYIAQAYANHAVLKWPAGKYLTSQTVDLSAIFGAGLIGNSHSDGGLDDWGQTEIVITSNNTPGIRVWASARLENFVLRYQTQQTLADTASIALQLNNIAKASFQNIRIANGHINVGITQAGFASTGTNFVFSSTFSNIDSLSASHTHYDFRNYVGGGTNVVFDCLYINGGGALDFSSFGQSCAYGIRGTNWSGYEFKGTSIDALTFTENLIECENAVVDFRTLRFESVRTLKNGGKWMEFNGGNCLVTIGEFVLYRCRSWAADGVFGTTIIKGNAADYNLQIDNLLIDSTNQFTTVTRRIATAAGASVNSLISTNHVEDPSGIFTLLHNDEAVPGTLPISRIRKWNGCILSECLADGFSASVPNGWTINLNSGDAPGGGNWATNGSLRTWDAGTRICVLDAGDIGRIVEWFNPLGGLGSYWYPSAYSGDVGNTNVGDANATFNPITSRRTLRWNTTLTANRTLTLSAAPANTGGFRVRVTRPAAGAFTLTLGATGKTLAAGQWADIEYDNFGAITVVAGGTIP